MISYCIACYRPTYTRLLVDDLLAKTSVPFEILIWLNVDDPAFEAHLRDLQTSGAPIQIVGHTPENLGMAVYHQLFDTAQYEMVVQIDDDVVCVSPEIAQTAARTFDQFPNVGMLVADVWQDEYTTGARPPMSHYRTVDRTWGLYDGPIDGWFAVYRRSSLPVHKTLGPSRYQPLGSLMKHGLEKIGMAGLLCTRLKVFHVIGPQYAHYFGMREFEIEKYTSLGRLDIVRWYEDAGPTLPDRESLAVRVAAIREHLAVPPVSAAHATSTPGGSAPPSSQWIWPDAGARSDGDLVVLEKLLDPANGSESGLVGALPFADVLLEFDLSLDPGACFLAKIHQQSADDQHSNSYHLVVADGRAYCARHDHVFCSFPWPHAEWSSVALAYSRSTLSLLVDGVVRRSVRDLTLPTGFCFVGVRGGRARLRNLRLS